MNKTTLLGFAMIAAVLAWPAVETYRYYQAQQVLFARLDLSFKVDKKLALARQRHATAGNLAGAPKEP